MQAPPNNPTQTRKPSQFQALFRLLAECRVYRGTLTIVFCLGLVISAIQPVSVKITQRMIDELQVGASTPFFRYLPIILICVFLVSGFSKYFYNTLRRYVTERIVLKLRASLFEKYCRMPLALVDLGRTGEMVSHLQNDLAQIASGMETVCDLLKEPFTFLGLMAMAFYCDWRLTLGTLVVAPLVALLFSRSGAAVKRYSRNNMQEFGNLSSLAQETLVGARVVKVFRLEETLMKKFSLIHEKYFKTVWKSIRVQELGTPAVEFIGALLIATVIVYGSYRVETGAMTTGQLIGFIIAIGLSQMPIKQLNNTYLKLRTAEAAAERVFAILDRPDRILGTTGGKRKSDFRQSVEFDDVSLIYGEKLALSGVSFEVKHGECVALVGHSGGGKSSIVNLLPRLYEVSSGHIRIDGTDIREIDLGDLRSLFSFVTQDTFLFHDTLFENIRYGRSDATDREIEAAARVAHCMDFIERSTNGFHTVIGDRGVCLSGGERQRIAIARAVLKGAPILVLDEATSSLDSTSEQIVQSALDRLMKNRTTFLVAHRFSTLRKANRILVVEGGRLLEQGTHAELIQNEGTYTSLFQQQTSWSN